MSEIKKYTVLFLDGSYLVGDMSTDKTVYETMEQLEKLSNTKFPEIQYIFDFDVQSQSTWSDLSKKWMVSIDIYKKNLHK